MPIEYLVTVSKYDTDGQKIKLPKELKITVPDGEEDPIEYISDEISNITGFCHEGFTTIPEINS